MVEFGRVVSCVVLLAAILLSASCRREPPKPPTRVVLVTIDTLRADHLGTYGYPRNTSPFLDRLASEGVAFEAARATSSHTTPSHASLFTGLYPVEHGVRNNGETLDPSIPTLAELYREAGYQTASFSTVRFLRGVQRGFDSQNLEQSYQPAGTIIENAWQWLKQREPQDNVFVWIHLFDVHEWYRPARISRRGKRALHKDEAYSGETINRWLEARYQPQNRTDRARLFRTIDHYDAQIIAVDEQLSWLYDQLEDSGKGDNNLWIVTSDHGEGLLNHGYEGHGEHIYREQLEVPLIVRWPEAGWAGGRRIEGLVQHVDLSLTLAELIPGELSSGTTAVPSLMPQLRGTATRSQRQFALGIRRPKGDNPLFEKWPDGELVSIEDERFKIIGNLQANQQQLDSYNLETDPLEWSKSRLETPDASPPGLLAAQLISRHEAMVAIGKTPAAGLDKEDRKELEALGYLAPEESEDP